MRAVFTAKDLWPLTASAAEEPTIATMMAPARLAPRTGTPTTTPTTPSMKDTSHANGDATTHVVHVRALHPAAALHVPATIIGPAQGHACYVR